MNSEQKITICACGSPDHNVIWTIDEDEIYLTYHLKPHTFFKRIWTAIRYVCGYRSIYGDFGELVINQKEAVNLHKLLFEFIQTN